MGVDIVKTDATKYICQGGFFTTPLKSHKNLTFGGGLLKNHHHKSNSHGFQGGFRKNTLSYFQGGVLKMPFKVMIN